MSEGIDDTVVRRNTESGEYIGEALARDRRF